MIYVLGRVSGRDWEDAQIAAMNETAMGPQQNSRIQLEK